MVRAPPTNCPSEVLCYFVPAAPSVALLTTNDIRPSLPPPNPSDITTIAHCGQHRTAQLAQCFPQGTPQLIDLNMQLERR